MSGNVIEGVVPGQMWSATKAFNVWSCRKDFNECYISNKQTKHVLEADIFSGIPRDGKQNRYESRDWDGRGKYLIGSGRDRE